MSRSGAWLGAELRARCGVRLSFAEEAGANGALRSQESGRDMVSWKGQEGEPWCGRTEPYLL